MLKTAAAVALLGAATMYAQVKAFTGARIFDGTGAPAVTNGIVIVEGGRVTAIGPAARVQIPAGAQRITSSTGTLVITRR